MDQMANCITESKPGWPATNCTSIPLKLKSSGSDLLVVWRNALLTLCSCLAPPSNQFLVSVTSALSSTKICPWRHTWGEPRNQPNQRVLLSSSPASSGPALIDNWHCSRPCSGFYSQSLGLLQWRVCRSASGSVQPSQVCTSGHCVTRPWPVMSAICDTLHWLSYPQRVTFKLCLTTYKCLHGLAPPYLNRFCTPLSAVAGRTHLHSADQHKLFVPRTSTSTFGLSDDTIWHD